MIISLHFITNLILFVVCASMGIMFLSINTPKRDGLKNYRISLKVLASAYIVLALLTAVVLVFKLPDNARELFTFTSIIISSFQAFLFTTALVALFNPKFVTFRYLTIQLSPYILFSVLFSVSYAKFGNPVIVHFNEIGLFIDNPTLWVRLAFFVFYVIQLLGYTIIFFKQEDKYTQRAMNYFSDDVWLKLSWVRWAFLSALVIGLLAMISYFFPQKYDFLFTITYSVFYIGFALEYIKYNKIYKFIEQVVIQESPIVETTIIKTRIKYEWADLKECILSNGYYLEAGINIEEIAKRLRIGRTTLSNLINREENLNFNAWINNLRIEKAKQILLEKPDEPLSDISEKVGYTEQANFSRQFRIVTGDSPTLWRQKHCLLLSETVA